MFDLQIFHYSGSFWTRIIDFQCFTVHFSIQ